MNGQAHLYTSHSLAHVGAILVPLTTHIPGWVHNAHHCLPPLGTLFLKYKMWPICNMCVRCTGVVLNDGSFKKFFLLVLSFDTFIIHLYRCHPFIFYIQIFTLTLFPCMLINNHVFSFLSIHCVPLLKKRLLIWFSL